MAENEAVDFNQSVEALVDTELNQVVTLVYDIENLGTFFRIDGKWTLGTSDIAIEFDGTEITELDYEKASELVKRFDDNELLTSEDLVDYEEGK